MTFLEWLAFLLGWTWALLGVWFIDMSSHRIRGKRFHYGNVVVMTEAEPGLGGPPPPMIVGMSVFQQNDARHAAFLSELTPTRLHIDDLEVEWLRQEIQQSPGNPAPVSGQRGDLWMELFDAQSVPGRSRTDRQYTYLGTQLALATDRRDHISDRWLQFWNFRLNGLVFGP